MTRIIKKPGELFAGTSEVLPARAPVLTSVFALALALPLFFSPDAAQAQGASQERSPQETFPRETSQESFEIFDIGAQPLQNALLEFSEQTDIVVVAPAGLVRGKTAPRVSGQFAPYEALERLLRGSGLHYARGRDGEVTIIAVPNNSDVLMHNSGAQMAQIQPDRNEDEAGQTPATGQDRDTPQQQEDELLEIEEIVITGSHIRGVGLSVGSKVRLIDRVEIDRSGFASTQQVLQSLPQVFQGGPNEDTFLGAASSNVTSASSVNLRGLGADSTLLLVNGRRVPVAGNAANFTDVSNIPVTAIERIEVLPDGASAIYGSDAIAGVVNIILRDDFEGAETRARFGTVTEGSLQEYQLGQTFGTHWNTGNALISYEYYKRDPLPNLERDFAADSDLRPLGGDNFSNTFSNPGNIVSLATFMPAFAIPTGQDGTSLTPADLIAIGGDVEPNFNNNNEGRNLLQQQERHSVFAALSQNISDGIEVFAEGRFTQRDFTQRLVGQPASFLMTPVNPFFVDAFGGGTPYLLFYNLVDDFDGQILTGDVKSYNGVLGGRVKLGGDWEANFYGSYSKEDSFTDTPNFVDPFKLIAAVNNPDPTLAFNPYADGSANSPAVLQSVLSTEENSTLSDSEVWSLNLVADGTFIHLPGGGVKLAAGVDFRKETLEQAVLRPTFVIPTGRIDSEISREVFAAFAELYIPLFSEENRRPGFENLSISIAGRFEDYNDSGTTTNPKLGVLWTPVEGLNLRGTWGKSFKAPNLVDRDRSQNVDAVLLAADPTSPAGQIFALTRNGRAPDLQNEESTSWTLGFDYAPPAVPGLRLDLTYFKIDFKDRLSSPRNILTVLIEEERFSSIINRDPTQEELDEVCNSEFFDPTAGFGDCTLPIEAIIDARLRNTARTKLTGLDFNIYYGFDTAAIGRFDIHLNGNYLIDFEEQFDAAAPVFQLADTVNNPVDFRMRNSLTWSNQNGFSATAFLNYVDSYTDNLSSPERGVDSWTTVDLTVSYRTDSTLSNIGLNNTTFSINVLNLFSTDPPFVNNPQGVGYDPENADPLGRFISFNITKKW